MRAYFFTNYYLSSLQKGLQTAHVVGELSTRFATNTLRHQIYTEWAEKHKTIVVLNGGNQQGLISIEEEFSNLHHDLPWASFYEDEQSLNNCLTCVGIVIPTVMVEAASAVRNGQTTIEFLLRDGFPMDVEDPTNQLLDRYYFSKDETRIIEIINSYGLAN